MTVGEFLKSATGVLSKAEVGSARLDVLVLLEDTLDKNRANLLAHPEMPISPADLAKLNKHITQREKHIPLAYIRGRAPFYGRDFVVNKHVLVPRPETESLIELAKELPLSNPRVADVGSGSGCVGITFALEVPASEVTLIDIDENALEVSMDNAARLGADVWFCQTNLLQNLANTFDVVLANLPYVPDNYPINEAAKHEPKLALFAGDDGLDLYRKLFHQLEDSDETKYVITESLEEQHSPLAGIAKAAGYTFRKTDGLAQLFERTS